MVFRVGPALPMRKRCAWEGRKERRWIWNESISSCRSFERHREVFFRRKSSRFFFHFLNESALSHISNLNQLINSSEENPWWWLSGKDARLDRWIGTWRSWELWRIVGKSFAVVWFTILWSFCNVLRTKFDSWMLFGLLLWKFRWNR